MRTVNLITRTVYRTGHNEVTESGAPEKMSVSTSQSSHSQAGRSANGKGNGQVAEGDLGVFNLRDTLSGISVREANFSEFLAVLKQSGLQTVK
jgi:hypothetical protein